MALLLFGLSGENLRRLRQAQLIKIDLGEMVSKGMAVIFYGKTEAAMVAALREAGILSEDLITHPMHDDQEGN